jgi:glycosyltransferase involved in cell wall biosynthesis
VSARPEISIVSPLYNESGNVVPLVTALGESLGAAGIDYELVLVDDGSSDGTWEAIAAIAARDPRVRGVALSRNFGHQGALLAGLNHARGRAVVSMDGDLQHPPAVVPALVAAWREGYKVVNTRRSDSADTGAFKRFTSRAFYRVFSALSGVPLESGLSDFRLVDRSALSALTRMGDADLFIRGIVSWLGFKTKVVPYQAGERHSGRPKFTLRRMFRLSTGAMLSFSALPLRLGIGIGFVTSVLAFLELCYILYVYARGEVVPGWASVMTVMSFMFGILFVLLGVIGTYLGKIYEILKRRPRYVVGERVGFADGEFAEQDRDD